MRIKSLESARRNADGSYNLYFTATVNGVNIPILVFPCTARHDMRLDLICYDIYDNTDNIDLLCDLNGIINTFAVKDGDEILYVEEEFIETLTSSDSYLSNIQEQLKTANKGKVYKTDTARQKDIEQRRKREKDKVYTSPTMLGAGDTNLRYENGNLILKPNF